MGRLTLDGTAEPVARDQFSGAYGDGGIFIFTVQLTTSRIVNLTRLIHTLLYVMTIDTLHTYIHTTYINRHAETPNKTKQKQCSPFNMPTSYQ